MNGFKRRRKALEKKSERMRDAKGVRACARDAQTLTPRAGARKEKRKDVGRKRREGVCA